MYINFIGNIRPLLSHKQFDQDKLSVPLLICFFRNFRFGRKQEPWRCVYQEFKKVFNAVAHQELLLKLWRLGITDLLRFWWAYLSDYQSLHFSQKASSTSLPVLSGVPQGVFFFTVPCIYQ